MVAWDDLAFVLAVHRHKSSAAAGRALGVNATTVTRRIQALEDTLGAKLFDRGRDGAVVTPAGEVAVRTALAIEREVHDLDAEIRGLDGQLQGQLRVTAVDIIFDIWRNDLSGFQETYPDVELMLLSSTQPVDLNRREADVAIRLSDNPPDHLVGRRVVEVYYAVYAATSLIDRLRTDGPLPYSAYPWISWDEPFAEATDRVIRARAPGATVRRRVNTLSTLAPSVQDGVGVSVMPCFHGDKLEGVVRLGDYFEGGLYLWVLTHEHLRRSARVRAFTEFAGRLIDRDAELYLGRCPRAPTYPVVPALTQD